MVEMEEYIMSYFPLNETTFNGGRYERYKKKNKYKIDYSPFIFMSIKSLMSCHEGKRTLFA